MTPVGSQRHKKKFVDNVKHIDKRTWSRVQFSYSGTGIYKQQQGRKFYFLCTLCPLIGNRKGCRRTVMEDGRKQVYSEQVDVPRDFQFYRIYHHLIINFLPSKKPAKQRKKLTAYIFSHNLEIYCGK